MKTWGLLMKRFVPVLMACAGLLSSFNASAVDGVIEISSACINFGCMPGDSAGAPVTISQSGSYILTSNLSTTNADTTLIEISASDVSLNLNGFTISGVTTCANTPVTACSNTGNGIGVDVNNDRVRVYNGNIRNMGNVCLSSTLDHTVNHFHDLTVSECGGAGIVSPSGLISDVLVNRVGGQGILIFIGNTLVKDSHITGNRTEGQLGGVCANNVFQGNGSALNCVQMGPNICDGVAC
jgi:hypothetical protein